MPLIDSTVNDLLASTAIPIPQSYHIRSKQRKPASSKFYLLDDLSSSYSQCIDSSSTLINNNNSCHNNNQQYACTNSLATVLMAKKNSFTVSPVSSTPSYLNSNDSFSFYSKESSGIARTELSTSPLSSSPESTFSDFSFEDDNSFLYTHSNNSIPLSKSRLSSVTSLSSADECHPLAATTSIPTESDEDSQTVASVETSCSQPTELKKKRSLVSNLSQSLKKLASSTSSTSILPPVHYYSPFALSSRNPTTDSSSVNSEAVIPREIQLKTFNVKTIPLVDNWDLDDSISTIPNTEGQGYSNCRSIRPSPLFLKLYAIENVAQQKKLIPNIFDLSNESATKNVQPKPSKPKSTLFSFLDDSDDEDSDDEDLEDDYAYLNSAEYIELGDKAKLKLFNHIKLHPRSDLPSSNQLKNVKYIPTTNTDHKVVGKNSLINKHHPVKSNNITPWIQFDDVELYNKSMLQNKRKQFTLKTHGVMKQNVQFTVKGYVNPRWAHKEY